MSVLVVQSQTPTIQVSKTQPVIVLSSGVLNSGTIGSGVTSVALTVPADLSVSGSPITTSGTLAVTRNTQAANVVLAGPGSGSAAIPAYRSLVAADLPASGATAGTYGSDADVAQVTVDAYGRVTAASSVAITPAAIGAIATSAEGAASGVATLDSGAHLTPAQFPALTGDVTSVAGAVATTLADSGVTAGTYGSGSLVPVVTVDAKGRVTAVTTAAASSGFANPMTTQYDLIVGGASGAADRFGAPTAAGTYGLQFNPSTGFTYATWPSGGGGTVTSVALQDSTGLFTISGSPVTASGTLTLSGLATQNPNVVFAGPASGSAAAPTFRSIVPADLPVFVASGASAAAGAVPSPGTTAGATRFLREDATWDVPASSGSGGIGASITPAIVTSGYYHVAGMTIGGSGASIGLSINAVYAFPFSVSRACTPTEIGIYVSAAGSSATQVGIYSDNGGLPDTLLSSNSQVATSSTGFKASAPSPSITLQPGIIYWMAVGNGSAAFSAVAFNQEFFTAIAAQPYNSAVSMLQAALASGWASLPSSLSGASWSYSTLTYVPAVYFNG